MKSITVPYNSAGWLLRALLRNAFTQLRVTKAIALAKENRKGTNSRQVNVNQNSNTNSVISQQNRC